MNRDQEMHDDRVPLSSLENAPVFSWPGAAPPVHRDAMGPVSEPMMIKPPPGLEIPPWRELELEAEARERRQRAPWQQEIFINGTSPTTTTYSGSMSPPCGLTDLDVPVNLHISAPPGLAPPLPTNYLPVGGFDQRFLNTDYSGRSGRSVGRFLGKGKGGKGANANRSRSPSVSKNAKTKRNTNVNSRFLSPAAFSNASTRFSPASDYLDDDWTSTAPSPLYSPMMGPSPSPSRSPAPGRRSPRFKETGEEYTQMVYSLGTVTELVYVNDYSWSGGNPLVRVKQNLHDVNDIMVERKAIQCLAEPKKFKVHDSTISAPQAMEEKLPRSGEPPRGHWKMVPKYFDMVRNGIKKIEGRPIMGAAATKNIGQLVTLVEKGDNSKRLKIKMTAKHKFRTFEDMFRTMGVQRFLPDFADNAIDEAVEYYRKMPFFAMQEADKGVVAVEFSLQADQCDDSGSRFQQPENDIVIRETRVRSPPSMPPPPPPEFAPLSPRPADWISIADL